MKSILAIPLILLNLFSGIGFTLVFHYYAGSVIPSRISLNRKRVTWGTEYRKGKNSLQNLFSADGSENFNISKTTLGAGFLNSKLSGPVQTYNSPLPALYVYRI